jgi:riboflavin kinase/FMN adenylyltransferase
MHTPTVNLRFPENTVLPRFGVYASIVTIDGERYIGVTNVGVKPTITDAGIPNCETWMPEYRGGKLYGKTVDVRLRDFIRPERKFSGLQELEEAIKRDGNTALSILK